MTRGRYAGEWLSVVYLIGLALVLLACQLFAGTSPLFALISTFSPFLFVPALLLPVALVALRSTTILGVTVAVVALFLLTYRPLPTSAFNRVDQARPSLSMMTFNLSVTTPAEQLAETIALADRDVVAVQELTPRSAAVLDSTLAAQYPYRILDVRTGTVGLLSKFPIVEQRWHYPPVGRPIIHALVDWPFSQVNVFAVHFSSPGIIWIRPPFLPRGIVNDNLEIEISSLLQQTLAASGPVVVLGDFNMSDRSRAYDTIAAQLTDAFREAGFGLGHTFPNSLNLGRIPLPAPLVRIDYTFHSPHLQATTAHVKCVEGRSDHCVLMTSLQLNQTRAVRSSIHQEMQRHASAAPNS